MGYGILMAKHRKILDESDEFLMKSIRGKGQEELMTLVETFLKERDLLARLGKDTKPADDKLQTVESYLAWTELKEMMNSDSKKIDKSFTLV